MNRGPEYQAHVVGRFQRFLGVLHVCRPRALCGYRLPSPPDWAVSLPPCQDCAEQTGWLIRPEMRTV